MDQSTIVAVHGWEALDSRGKPTVGCTVRLADGSQGRAIVPSGASTGGYEAVELRDGGDRYRGQGVRDAAENVRSDLAAAVVGVDGLDQVEIDRKLELADGTPELSRLGANAVLAVSLAALQAGAASKGMPLWEGLGGPDALIPMPMVNIISGGAHARGLLDIQDVLVIPHGAASFSEAIEWADRVRRATASILEERGIPTALVADEGGLAGTLGDNRTAFVVVTEGISRAGLTPGTDVSIAVDLAANQLFADGAYHLRVERRDLSATEWLNLIDEWCAEFPIASIEDILGEDDGSGWSEAYRRHGGARQLIGDDLFATNKSRLEAGIKESQANAVLVKPNQAGTVTRAHNVLMRAQEYGLGTIVSARSGDTEDFWLADLAVGWGAGQIKVGSTMRAERTAKWNRLLEIESLQSIGARFAGVSYIPGLA